MSIRARTFLLSIIAGFCWLTLSQNPAFAVATPAVAIGGACSQLGETRLATDQTTVIGCFKSFDTQANCGTAAAPTCVYKQMAQPANLVRVSFELVGGGGGGGGGDWMTWGGPGGAGAIVRFDTYLPFGAPLTLSVGSGGVLGETNLIGKVMGDGGSGLMANGGDGGGTDGSNWPQIVGPSGIGGGGGAATVVRGEGLFAVAGGGGGGGGGSLNVNGSAGNLGGDGGAPGPNGMDGKNGCDGRDGGGGGGGGGGYPGGLGGGSGCDYSRSAQGGNRGASYAANADNGLLAFSKWDNSAGAGVPGGGGAGGVAAATSGSCGRITIWTSTNSYVFTCGAASNPQWRVK